MWVMTRLDSSSEDYLAKSGASVDRKKTHNFHIRKDGTIRVTALPVDLAQGRAAIFDASGKWRLVAPASSGRRWQLLLLLDEPKRGLSYDFYKDEAGLFLRGHFDPEDLGVIEFRQEQ